jgi:hypothetical protein
MSMVDGFPYKEEVGGSNPSVPTIIWMQMFPVSNAIIVRQGTMMTSDPISL